MSSHLDSIQHRNAVIDEADQDRENRASGSSSSGDFPSELKAAGVAPPSQVNKQVKVNNEGMQADLQDDTVQTCSHAMTWFLKIQLHEMYEGPLNSSGTGISITYLWFGIYFDNIRRVNFNSKAFK